MLKNKVKIHSNPKQTFVVNKGRNKALYFKGYMLLRINKINMTEIARLLRNNFILK